MGSYSLLSSRKLDLAGLLLLTKTWTMKKLPCVESVRTRLTPVSGPFLRRTKLRLMPLPGQISLQLRRRLWVSSWRLSTAAVWRPTPAGEEEAGLPVGDWE